MLSQPMSSANFEPHPQLVEAYQHAPQILIDRVLHNEGLHSVEQYASISSKLASTTGKSLSKARTKLTKVPVTDTGSAQSVLSAVSDSYMQVALALSEFSESTAHSAAASRQAGKRVPAAAKKLAKKYKKLANAEQKRIKAYDKAGLVAQAAVNQAEAARRECVVLRTAASLPGAPPTAAKAAAAGEKARVKAESKAQKACSKYESCYHAMQLALQTTYHESSSLVIAALRVDAGRVLTIEQGGAALGQALAELGHRLTTIGNGIAARAGVINIQADQGEYLAGVQGEPQLMCAAAPTRLGMPFAPILHTLGEDDSDTKAEALREEAAAATAAAAAAAGAAAAGAGAEELQASEPEIAEQKLAVVAAEAMVAEVTAGQAEGAAEPEAEAGAEEGPEAGAEEGPLPCTVGTEQSNVAANDDSISFNDDSDPILSTHKTRDNVPLLSGSVETN